MLIIYNEYIFSLILLNNKYYKKKLKISLFIVFSIILYFLTYYIICDSNPVFSLITYYIFFPNFFKAILIILIHTYFLSQFHLNEKFEFFNKKINHQIKNSPKFYLIFQRINYYFISKKYYFLSNFIILQKK